MAANNQVMEFMSGSEKIKLTPNIVREYMISGDKERVTLQEIVIFMNLCKANHLNPWVREAYCIKYGNEPATIVIGKEAFLKRAELNSQFDGYEAGIIVKTPAGDLEERRGTLWIEGEEIVGGYAEVWRKDRAHSTRIEVSFAEYAGRRKDGSLNGQWSKKPATMIRKVALVQALREAFPGDFGAMYTAEEQGVDEPVLAPIEPQEVRVESDVADVASDPVPKAGEPEAEPVQEEMEFQM